MARRTYPNASMHKPDPVPEGQPIGDTMQLFYWNPFHAAWVLIPDEVKDFLGSIPKIQLLKIDEPEPITIKFLLSKYEGSLPKVIR